jgi:arginyl-tRNA synthetase
VFHLIEKQVSNAFRAHIQARYGVDLQVNIEQPRQSDLGEMAVPAAFQLAKQLRQAPKKIAAELVDEIGPIQGVARMEVAGNGYINLRLDRGAYGAALLRGDWEAAADTGGKIIVEHTNINPNKAAHIGHLRNATLGDTFVRMLRARGQRVEVQNYIDNTGVQVADVVVGFRYLENKTALRLLLLGPLRPDIELLQREPRRAQVAQRDPARHGSGRRRWGRTGAPGGGCHCGSAYRDHAAAGRGIRRAAARE